MLLHTATNMDKQTLNVDKKQKTSSTIISALVSAVLEWLLICMIFIHAILSYLVTKFARSCHLQIPCLLCSRLDHVLGNKRSTFCWDLVCKRHKLKISSLIFCQIHDKLIDVHGARESCFFSFATTNKSNAETYRLLVGELGPEPHLGMPQGDSSMDQNLDFSGTRNCFCCNGKYTSRSNTHKIFHTKSIDSEVGEIDSSLHVASKYDRDVETPEKDLVSFPHLESENNNSFSYVESEAPLQHGLEVLKWEQAEQSNSVNVSSELISFDDAVPSSKTNEIHYDLKETIVTSATNLGKEVSTYSTEAHTIESESKGTTKETSKEIQSNSNTETNRGENDSILETDIYMNSKPSKTGTNSPSDLGEVYKLALGTRGRQLSGRFLEQQRSMTDSSRACEDLKLLLSQISTNYDMSPRLSANYDNYKTMESFGSTSMQVLQRRISLERNESNLSLDGSTVSEIEGESSVDRLKRQVEHDKKVMSGLYKELEEERNASAVAANQAMAMITRLQEEKASLHMEALQFLRMMEEQAEYDGEALQRANGLLVEKEKQIQEFESELELYRNQIGDLSLSTNVNAETLEAKLWRK